MFLYCQGTLVYDYQFTGAYYPAPPASGRPACDGDWLTYSVPELSALLYPEGGLPPSDPVDPAEVAAGLNDFYVLLNSVFSTPDTSEILLAVSSGFSLPMLVYVVCRVYGSIISFIK